MENNDCEDSSNVNTEKELSNDTVPNTTELFSQLVDTMNEHFNQYEVKLESSVKSEQCSASNADNPDTLDCESYIEKSNTEESNKSQIIDQATSHEPPNDTTSTENKENSVPSKISLRTRTTRRRYAIENDGVLSCSVCYKTFSSLMCLDRHLQNVHRNKFPLKTEISEDGKFQCSFCPSLFASKYNRDRHERKFHTGDTKFICDICPCSFNVAIALKLHMIRYHKLEADHLTSKGDIIHPVILIEDIMKLNETAPKNESSFTSKKPRREFQRRRPTRKKKTTVSTSTKANPDHKSKLKTKRTVIVYATDLTCSYCPRSFSTIRSRKNHENFHTGEMPYSCNLCGGGFRERRTLKKHMNICLQNIPPRDSFICPYCCVLFISTKSLNIHIRKNHANPHSASAIAKSFFR